MEDPAKKQQYLQMADINPSQLLKGEVPHLIDEWQLALRDSIDDKKMSEPAFMMVLCGVAPFAYRRSDGVFVVPIGCLRN